jgi:iron-sulfur cluster repair protein YtfE (RIC family)
VGNCDGDRSVAPGTFAAAIDRLKKCHRTMYETIADVQVLLRECASSSRGAPDAVQGLRGMFEAIVNELHKHFADEEERLFPAMLELEAGRLPAQLPGLIADARAAHDLAGDATARAQVNLTGALTATAGLGARHLAELRDRLFEFQRSIAEHIEDEERLLEQARALMAAGRAPRRS